MTDKEKITLLEERVNELTAKLIHAQSCIVAINAATMGIAESLSPTLQQGYTAEVKRRFLEAVPIIVERYKTVPATLKVILQTTVQGGSPLS